MVSARFRSRKLFLLLVFFSLDSLLESQTWLSLHNINSIEDSDINKFFFSSSEESSTKIEHNDTVWIVDEQRNQCLNPHGFSECGDLSEWIWKNEGDKLMLQQKDETQGNHCLGWKYLSKKFVVMNCKIAHKPWISRRTKSVHWSFDFETGQLQSPIGILEKILPFSPFCVVNDNRHRLQRCNRFATRLKVVRVADVSLNDNEVTDKNNELSLFNEVVSVSTIPDVGYWYCPKTGLALPRNLDKYNSLSPIFNSEIGGRQVLMGAGLFTKSVFGMTFNVYNLGWYVDAAAAQLDPFLMSFSGKSFEELQSSTEFYNALITSGQYDRSLFIKLAMTLKKDVVVQGIIEELPLQKKNADRLLDASMLYPHGECVEGLEILFKWRKPRSSNNFRESLEIIIGEFRVSIDEPGLAEDFFHFYIRSEDPISEEARAEFPRNFPALLRGGSFIPSTDETRYQSGSQYISKPFSFKQAAIGYFAANYGQVKRVRKWKAYMNSLLLRDYRNWHQDFIITAAVIVYSIVLIVISLPPSLIERGVRAVHRVKKRSIHQLNAAIERTFSRSRSLASLARPSSLAAMARSASSEFKVFFESNFKNMQ